MGIGELEFDGVSLSYMEFDVDMNYKDTGIKSEMNFAQRIKKTADWIKETG